MGKEMAFKDNFLAKDSKAKAQDNLKSEEKVKVVVPRRA